MIYTVHMVLFTAVKQKVLKTFMTDWTRSFEGENLVNSDHLMMHNDREYCSNGHTETNCSEMTCNIYLPNSKI